MNRARGLSRRVSFWKRWKGSMSSKDKYRWLKKRDSEDESSMAALAFALNDIGLENIEKEDAAAVFGDQSDFLVTDDLTVGHVEDLLEFLKYSSARTIHPMLFQKILKESKTILSALPNVVCVEEAHVHVVGDLHGQLDDLLHIFEVRGFPSAENVYVFNGDLVDRGSRSVEVLATVLALKIATPEGVHLNRGNHEDGAVATAYGFREEVKRKFSSENGTDAMIWKHILEVFSVLPLATVLKRHGAFVVHGGPTVHDVEDLNRDRVTLMSENEDSKDLAVMRDLLWSDCDENIPGLRDNEVRRCGKFYGLDVVRKFLEEKSLRILVRSHECVYEGVSRVPIAEDTNMHLYTVFSATDYPNRQGFNKAGLLTFTKDRSDPLVYSFESEELDSEQSSEFCFDTSLQQQIAWHRHALREAFNMICDSRKRVTVSQWCDVMTRIVDQDIDWLVLQPSLARVVMRATVDNGGSKFVSSATNQIAFERFLDESVRYIDDDMEEMFRYQRQLSRIFVLLDADSSGDINIEEFVRGISLLNRHLTSSLILNDDTEDMKALFHELDTNGDGKIDHHEFSRLQHALAIKNN